MLLHCYRAGKKNARQPENSTACHCDSHRRGGWRLVCRSTNNLRQDETGKLCGCVVGEADLRPWGCINQARAITCYMLTCHVVL